MEAKERCSQEEMSAGSEAATSLSEGRGEKLDGPMEIVEKNRWG